MPEILTLEVGTMVHGGHCIARYDGRVIFVRHAIPGETVRAVITSGGDQARFWRADVVDVVAASDHRRRHPWKQADSLRAHDQNQLPVGGAEYGHISEPHQRRLKAQVFRDTLSRIGGIQLNDLDLASAAAEGDLHVRTIDGSTSAGLGWRTRVSFAVHQGALAMKPHRSHELITLRSMPLAVEAIAQAHLFSWNFSGALGVDVVAPAGQTPLALVVQAEPGGDHRQLKDRLIAQAAVEPNLGSIILAVTETGAGRSGRRRRGARASTRTSYELVLGKRSIAERLPVPVRSSEGAVKTHVEIQPESFWQIHRGAPGALVQAVDTMTDLSVGGTMIDLYAGAGLFTAWAADRVTADGQVLSVEAAAGSSTAAQQLFAQTPGVEIQHQTAERVAAYLKPSDVLLLDPPRSGADKRVLSGIIASGPSQIAYVSCDPASFARDAKYLISAGWKLQDLRVLDMYPNTHHMESVALFSPR